MTFGNNLDGLRQDIRDALRMARRSPGFTSITILSLALGIGANTAVFSLIDTLMLKLLPVRDPQQLVEVLQQYPGEPRGNGFWSWRSYEHYRDQNHIFSGLIAAATPAKVTVRRDGDVAPETANGQFVSGNFFAVLGLEPVIGRLLAPDDEKAESTPAVVSWLYWKTRFNLDPAILGKQMVVQNLPVTIVGVAPRTFTGLQVGSKTDLWLPLVPSDSARVALLARLRDGVSIEQARAEMKVLFNFTVQERASNSEDPLIRRLMVYVEPAGAGLAFLRDRFARPLLVLMIIVGLILLLACTNIAGLLLARGVARQKEMCIRISLGASRFRLVRQAFTEALFLAATGSLLGLAFAYFGVSALLRLLTSGRPIIGLPQPLDISLAPDTHVLLFTAGVAGLSALLFGLAPAWTAAMLRPVSSLRDAGKSGGTTFQKLCGKSLVVTQVAISMVLLSAAALFVGHLSNLENIDLGFRRDRVLLVALDPTRNGSAAERDAAIYQELLARLQSIPVVRSVSLSAPTPLSGAGAAGFATVDGFLERPQDRRYVAISWVAPKYFETLGTPLLRGRDFDMQDQSREVAIINQAMARYYFSNRSPIGRRITLDHVTGRREPSSYEVVGVVGDAKYYEIREPAHRTIYLPAFENGRVIAQNFILRTEAAPSSVAGQVRSAISEVLGAARTARITTLTDQIDASIVPERLIAKLSGTFGFLGLVLAGMGLYGLLAYTVERRFREFGIRSALGASRGNLITLVIREAMKMVAIGSLIGAVVAAWNRDVAVSLIEGIQMKSTWPIAFGVVVLFLVAFLAAGLPAYRAAQVDPMEALRHE